MRRVAITGFGVVSPLGVGRQRFWQRLAAAESGIGPITRFDSSTFPTQLAGEVRQPLELPDQVAAVAAHDVKVGFGFAAAVEALAASGRSRLDERFLLHLGVSLESFDLGRAVHRGRPDFAHLLASTVHEGAPPLQLPLDACTRLVCTVLGQPGRALTNCSACAAGAQAIGHGFREVRAGRAELALCGGLDSMINPLGVGGFALLGALTTDAQKGRAACRPFAADRSGTVLGEGAAAVVLEPLDQVRAEGRDVLAEVCGFGSSLDAHSLSAPDPEGDGAARSMTTALADACLKPAAVDHVNAHGTATVLNDEVEATAIRRVFADCWQRIPVTATKALTGHLIAAAGPVELGACLLALVEGVIHANPWLQSVGPGCELAHVTSPTRFEGEHVLTNSFGFGGQNATLILRRPTR